MLSATFLDLTSDEIMTVGEVAVGDIYQGFCCEGHDWEVLHVTTLGLPPDYNTIWGTCHNPDCPQYRPDFNGLKNVLQCDFAERLAEQVRR